MRRGPGDRIGVRCGFCNRKSRGSACPILGETPDIADDREISFRLLRHYASSVRHQKCHGVDVVTVNVERVA